MKPFAEVMDRRWTWKRPRLWSRRFELCAGDDVIARLESRALPGGTWHGETARGHWQVRHVGLLRGLVTVTSPEGGEALTFRPRWFGAGDVSTAGGQSLRWHRADFWGRRWELVDSGGLARVVFERAPGFLRADTHVLVGEAARTDTELEPLVLAGFFLILLMARQSHAAV